MPAANAAPRDRDRRYEIEPAAWLRADRLAAAAGWEVLGCYHSHPAGGTAPSAVDAGLAWEGIVYLIAAAGPDGTWTAAAWRRAPGSGRWSAVALEERAA